MMLYAPRGIGKTHVALWMTYTISCGGEMFGKRWQCEKSRKVLFVDGEMPASTLQMRLSTIVASSALVSAPLIDGSKAQRKGGSRGNKKKYYSLPICAGLVSISVFVLFSF